MTAQELKNSILQFAIQGKLVKQDPNDEPASVLLEKIKVEREKLIKEKKIKKEKCSEIYKDSSDNHYYEKFEDGTINDITEEIPFKIPDSWRWCRLINASLIIFSGKSPKYSKVPNNNYVLGQKNNQDYGIDLTGIKYCTNEFENNYPKYLFLKKNDILLNTLGGGTIGRSGIFNLENDKYITDGHLFVIRNINMYISNYILYLLKLNRNAIERSADGSTNQTFLKLENVKKYLLPLPPEKELINITNKIELILPYIEKYNIAYTKLEKLNNSYKEELKKSILQYAIQGKLVKQNPEDEPASKLIEEIHKEKLELMKEKKIKKEDFSIIYKDSSDNQFYEKFDSGKILNITNEIPFEIPNNWCWSRIGNISYIKGGKRIPKGERIQNIPTEHIYIRVTDMKSNTICENDIKYISNNIYKMISNYTISSKDLYLTIAGTIGNVGIVPKRFDNMNLTENAAKICNILINKFYLLYIIQSQFVQKQFNKKTNKVAQPKLAIERIESTLISLPPLKEQKKISKKIKNLFDILK